MLRNILLLFCFTISGIVIAQEAIPFVIYNKKGKEVSFKKMIQKTSKSDVVLFGEQHDNSILHWLQLKVTQSLYKKRDLVLGAEMFEADNQAELNSYLKAEIDQDKMDTLVRLWPNYKTDYKPLVDFAKDKGLTFIATNVPRRYASIVFKQGVESLDTLTDKEKSWIAPLPFPYDKNLPSYVRMMEMFKDHANDNFPKAQAIKDATMAYFINKNWVIGVLFIHFNGSYHSDDYEGIYWYLNKYNPQLKISTISMVSQKNVSKLEEDSLGKADYIIVVDDDIIKTF